MSEATEAVLDGVHLVAAYSSVEPDYLLQAFLDPERAKAFLQVLRDYETTRPERQVLPNDDDEPLGDWVERIRAWSLVHPGGEHAAMYGQFAVRTVPLGDPPALLGYANARALGHFQDGRATSVDVVRDKATLWRSRGRDGDPVAVFVQGEDDSDLVSQAREALASGETPVPTDPAALRKAVDPSV